jgi:methyl-accepting chemotaxis protein
MPAKTTFSGFSATEERDMQLHALLEALKTAVSGDFSVRLPSNRGSGLMRQIVRQFNRFVELNAAIAKEITRVEQAVRREGRMTETASLPAASGNWLLIPQSVNALYQRPGST